MKDGWSLGTWKSTSKKVEWKEGKKERKKKGTEKRERRKRVHTWIHEYTGEESRAKGKIRKMKREKRVTETEREETYWDSVLARIKGLRPTRTWSNVYIRGGRMCEREGPERRVQRGGRGLVSSYLPRVINIMHEPMALLLVLRVDVGHCGSPRHQKGSCS